MGHFIRNVIWPKDFIGLLGRVVGALSILALLKHGIDFDFGQTFHAILLYYDALAGVLVGWAQPFIERWAHDWFAWQLALYPHWKHIFILVGVYFFRNASNYFSGNSSTEHRAKFYSAGIFLLVWGFLCALAVSIGSGLVAPADGDWQAQFQIAAVPVIGAFVFTLGRRVWHATFLRGIDGEWPRGSAPNWWQAVWDTIYRAGIRTLVGLALLIGGLQISSIGSLPSAGLALLVFLVLLLAAYWFWLGIARVKVNQKPGEGWRDTYWRLSSTKLGAAMLGVFFWAGVFLLTNAGLGLLGV